MKWCDYWRGEQMPKGAKTITVAELMSSPVVTASESDTIAEVGKRMMEAGVGSVVVVESGRVTGILTERDLVRFAAEGGQAAGATVSQWMTKDPFTQPPARTLPTPSRISPSRPTATSL
jgi:CBS domain-containing protein